jgi:hypothetical protein
MISRRLFLRLVSWSSVSALLWDPASAVALEEAPESQSPAPEPEFDYRVSTVRGLTDIDDWRAENAEEGVVLRWTTAFEYKIDRFVIEHQRPDQGKTGNWERLTSITAKGTTLNAHEYRHVASSLDVGTHRFRLKQVDEEGRTETTDSISVQIGGFLTWRADNKSEGIALRWETIFPARTPREFVVEQKPVGKDEAAWRVLGTVDAKADPSEPTAYQYEVDGLRPGGYHFRLKQVDESGRTTYTESVLVRASGFLKWNAESTLEGVVLRWTTVFFDPPVEKFVIEQKPSGREEAEWRVLGTVDGEDDPSGATAYRYEADSLGPGGHRFRLRRVDEDGRTTYTGPVSARVDGILEWEGKETTDGIELRWRTAFATPGDTFVVEHRRANGKSGNGDAHWKALGHLPEEDGDDRTQYRYVATDFVPGEHRFRLKRVRASGETTHTESLTVQRSMETAVRMTPPSPNPIRNQATFSFAVREAQRVTITVYDVLGREVRTVYRGTPPAGENQTVQLRGGKLTSGVYFVRLVADNHHRTRKFTVAR